MPAPKAILYKGAKYVLAGGKVLKTFEKLKGKELMSFLKKLPPGPYRLVDSNANRFDIELLPGGKVKDEVGTEDISGIANWEIYFPIRVEKRENGAVTPHRRMVTKLPCDYCKKMVGTQYSTKNMNLYYKRHRGEDGSLCAGGGWAVPDEVYKKYNTP